MAVPVKKELYRYQYNLAAPESEFAPDFIQKMANRMAVSKHKYGPVTESFGTVDHIKSLRQRLDLYEGTGNTEWLVDVANEAMIEYMKQGEDAFIATDSDESPGRTRIDGTIDSDPNIVAKQTLDGVLSRMGEI